MRAILFLAWSLLFPAMLGAQTPGPWTVAGPVDMFTTDELGNLYVLRGDELGLYDRQGNHKAHNSLNTFGPISGISAFSSLKPLIFSRQQGQLALLDNTLSIQGNPTDLARRGFPQMTLACMGVQNRIWFFDERNLALVRVDGSWGEVANSGRLDQLLSFTPQPVYMEESEGRLYLVDPAQGVLVFDLFGTFIRTMPITGTTRVQVRDGHVWYVREGRLERYDMKAFTSTEVPWPATGGSARVLDARIEQGRLYRLTQEAILVDPIGF